MRYAAIVEYLGKNYSGFQIQPNVKTIQGCLEDCLSRIANESIKIEASGRTDAGVHALGQVFHFDTLSVRSINSWVKGTNSFLPDDIKIRWINEVEQDFHARFNALKREYQYLLYLNKTKSAIWNDLSGWYSSDLNFSILDEVLYLFKGRHNFSSYRSSECQSKKPIKEIYEASYIHKDSFILFKFVADGYLHHQIRNMMSVILEVASGKKEKDYIDFLFKVKDRTKASNTFLPNGLYLANIEYDKKFKIPFLNNKILL